MTTTIQVPELETGTVGEAMTHGILTCLPVTPLRVVARMMATHRVHAIVVFGADDRLMPWGIVSDLDLIGAIGTHATAGSVAGSPVVTVTQDDTLEHAAQLMREHSTSHLVVIAERESPLPMGILSSLDIARALAAGEAPEEFASG